MSLRSQDSVLPETFVGDLSSISGYTCGSRLKSLRSQDNISRDSSITHLESISELSWHRCLCCLLSLQGFESTILPGVRHTILVIMVKCEFLDIDINMTKYCDVLILLWRNTVMWVDVVTWQILRENRHKSYVSYGWLDTFPHFPAIVFSLWLFSK